MPTASRLPGLETGLSGVCSAVVGPQDTCRSVGTADLDVLATPKVLAMLECAALDALADLLEINASMILLRTA
jgi:predicted thioesterase